MCGADPSQALYSSRPLSFLLQNLLFSVCGLTICAAIICTLSALVCCVQIFSLDLVHMVRRRQGPSPRGWWQAAGVWARTGLAKQ